MKKDTSGTAQDALKPLHTRATPLTLLTPDHHATSLKMDHRKMSKAPTNLLLDLLSRDLSRAIRRLFPEEEQ